MENQEKPIKTAMHLSCIAACPFYKINVKSIYTNECDNSGLGIGSTPSAFAAHGINTTVVEIDPGVHQLAMDYFGFPRDLTTYTEDATTFVERARKSGHRYDYLIHDVFTGGAEPIELFTQQFLQGLYDLLEDDGIIALVRFGPPYI